MFLSKHHDLQKILFGEIVFDDDLKIQNDVKEMMILKMLKYIRFIKISMMSYILDLLVKL
jgi:hypothetical protein